ncbi:V-type ATP synthase subunit E [Breznakiella homolactica]|uniref:V-type ATP synthase subunit E n=1 Tax=Breznakiella homolactica TaxID=2798577 RepID=A0A7T8B857_9SPIR|nr:V-type ATP synthase subunit E [Breznakiella homolactica]QQO08224.1 V-type ATP synthase subunit E [Breznakiella homolactica]
MDIQLQELIDKIKKDGIESASEEAARLKSQAESEAKRIVEAARKEADSIVAQGKSDAERSEKASIAAVEQASRNLVLAFKGEIQTLLDKIINREITASYGDDVLKTALPEVLKGWAAKGGDNLDFILPEGELKKLESFFMDKLSSELKKGVELKSDRNLGAGFRIAEKDGAAYYDFSAESVSELLSAYVNPRLAEILKEAAKGI